MKRRVVHHALHADEGVYRLVHAAEVDEILTVEGEDGELEEQQRVHHFDHRDVVWSAEDPRWKGLSAEQIAAEQRREVRDAHTRQIAALEAQQAQAQADVEHLSGSAGEEI